MFELKHVKERLRKGMSTRPFEVANVTLNDVLETSFPIMYTGYMEPNLFLHEVAVTAIIIKDGKYLITRRAPSKKRFPGMWTVPGGRLEAQDYLDLPKDTEHYWYNVLERVLEREVREEVGIDVKNVEYLTSLATVHADGSPSIVISCIADYAGGDVTLQISEADDFAWVSTAESEKYTLIDGIYEEFVQIDAWKETGVKPLWQRLK